MNVRYAAIDIGSNAVRLLIADIIRNEDVVSFKKNTLVRVPLRLGDDAFIDRRISESKAVDLVKTMGAFRSLMDVYKVSEYMACATSAMREAANGPSLLRDIREAGIALRIIDGSEEARIIYSSRIEQHLAGNKAYLYIDVGGGSTELSIFADGELIASASFNIGTIRILDNQDREETWEEMRLWVKTHTKAFKAIYGIGTGGSFQKVRADVQEDQLQAGILPKDPEYGIEPPGKEGLITLMKPTGEREMRYREALKGDYSDLFNAVYAQIRRDEPFPVKEEEIRWQLEILEQHAWNE